MEISNQDESHNLRNEKQELTPKQAKIPSGIPPNTKKTEPSTYAEVASSLYYWKLDQDADTGLYRLPDNIGDKYVVFLEDCGGFNNIRMGFEHAILIAWLTRRTLVIPPASPWYLLDNGPMVRMVSSEAGPGTSDFGIFFDMEHLRAAVPIISARNFVQREHSRMGIPSELVDGNWEHQDIAEKYKKWLHGELLSLKNNTKVNLEWSPLVTVIFFPTIASVLAQGVVPDQFVDRRKIVEFTPQILDKPLLSLPSCLTDTTTRYLTQMDAIVAFADEKLNRSYKRMLRDNVHYRRIVFDIAARVVQVLGKFQFSSMHVRRNDLQYKEVFLEAQAIIKNVGPLLKPGEKLYIATDEASEKWFEEFGKHYEVYRWGDFFTEKGKFALKGIEIPRKLEGCIEQVICALGRVFVGTIESTFTSYIYRLRGYYKTPNTEVYFQSIAYTGQIESDRKRTWAKKPVRGSNYKSEFRTIWEDPESEISDFRGFYSNP